MVSESHLLERLRERLVMACFVLGALIGLCKGWYAPGELNMLMEILIGGMGMPLMAAAGGVTGIVLRLLLRAVQGREHAPSESMGGPTGLLLGALCGGFLGGVASFMFLAPEMIRNGALFGAFLGGTVLSAAGDMADVLVQMLVRTGNEELDEEDILPVLNQLDDLDDNDGPER